MSAAVKPCTRCGEVKPLEDYARDGRRPGGRASHCRTCERARNRERSQSPEGRAWRVQYRAENAGHEAATKAQYAARNAELVRERKSKYYAENRERLAAHRAENPHYSWESFYRQRARRYGIPPVVESFTRDQLIARYGDQCAHCGGPFEQLDHYPVPVSRGGPHTLENCRPSCAGCNLESWRGAGDAQHAV